MVKYDKLFHRTSTTEDSTELKTSTEVDSDNDSDSTLSASTYVERRTDISINCDQDQVSSFRRHPRLIVPICDFGLLNSNKNQVYGRSLILSCGIDRNPPYRDNNFATTWV